MHELQDQLKNYILSECAFDAVSFGADDDLLGQGILDSMGVLKLVTFIEDTLGLIIDDEEIIPENFRSLHTLTELIEQKIHTQ